MPSVITEELKVYEENPACREKLECNWTALVPRACSPGVQFVVPIQQNARIIAQLDCLLSFRIAHRNKYVKPKSAKAKPLPSKPDDTRLLKNNLRPVISTCRTMFISTPTLSRSWSSPVRIWPVSRHCLASCTYHINGSDRVFCSREAASIELSIRCSRAWARAIIYRKASLRSW